MLTYTIGELIDGIDGLGRKLREEGYRVYVYRQSDIGEVLYVGQLYAPLARFADRLISIDAIGSHIKRHLPLSRTWFVDFFTPYECKDIVSEYCCMKNLTHPPAYLDDRVDRLERALIYHHQPSFNTAHKEFSTAETQRVAVRKLILEALAAASPDYPATLHHIAEMLDIQLFPEREESTS